MLGIGLGFPVACISSAALTAAGRLLAGESAGLAIDFTQLSLAVKDTTTPANNYDSTPFGKLTYTSPSIKMCRQSDGALKYGAHNLYLNSAAPANQSITVISGVAYAITLTGSVSITLSGAATGTVTSGTTAFTATTTTLTCGSTSGTGTVAVYRTPSTGTHLATTSAAAYELPYEYDASGNALGILVEEQRTNLERYSQQFDNAEWVVGNCSFSADTAVAPDGTTTADTLSENAATAARQVYGNNAAGALASGTVHTISRFVKPNGRNFVNLNLQGTANNYVSAVFDVSSANTAATQTSVGASSGTLVSTRQEAFANGWYRVSLTASVGTSATPVFCSAPAGTGNTFTTLGLISFAGNNSTALYVWGAQTEAGAFATSYIQTTSATVTRAGDNITLAASLFPVGTTGRSLMADVTGLPGTGTYTQDLCGLRNAANINEVFHFYYSGGVTATFINRTGGVIDASAAAAVVPTNRNKIAHAISSNNYAAYVNAVSAGTDASCSVSTPDQLRLGALGYGGGGPAYWLRSLIIVPRRMSNAELQTVTT